MYPFIIFFGGLIGVVSIVAVTYYAQYVQDRISAWWCRSPHGHSDRRFRKRMAWALSPRKATMLVPLLLPLFNPWYLTAFLGEAGRLLALACLGGYVGIAFITYPIYLHKVLAEFRKHLAMKAVRKLAKIGDNAFTENLLLAAAQSPEPMMRIVAAEGLQYLGTAAGNAALDKLCGDRNMQVSLAACHAAKELHRVLSGKHVLSLAPLEALLQAYDVNQRFLQQNSSIQKGELNEQVVKAEREIEKIIYSQLALRRAFPQVYCEKCHDFGELQAHADWRWVRCKVCHDATDLHTNIAHVIGQIGGDHAWEIAGNVLKVSLWDAENRRIIPGVIQAVEVIGGKALDYDWALSAVLEMLRNRAVADEKRIVIELVNAPALSENSLNLLRGFRAGSASVSHAHA